MPNESELNEPSSYAREIYNVTAELHYILMRIYSRSLQWRLMKDDNKALYASRQKIIAGHDYFSSKHQSNA